MRGLIALTLEAARELGPYGIRVHALGPGLQEYKRADAAVPHDLEGALLHLCGSSLNGQIVNLEAS
jgi:NAD(P)-dependent dehydrogenase (short-subunit alcohol dehydrogenase family)